VSRKADVPTSKPRPMVLDGCPRFAKAYLGRKRRAKPFERSYLVAQAQHPRALELKHSKIHFRPRYALANLGTGIDLHSACST
jgi:hypothetical protein